MSQIETDYLSAEIQDLYTPWFPRRQEISEPFWIPASYSGVLPARHSVLLTITQLLGLVDWFAKIDLKDT